MKVRGIDGLTLGELVCRVKDGGRFVVFDWCIGLGVRSVRRSSAVHFVRPNEWAAIKGIRYTLGTLLTGWWSIDPFGPAQTIGCLRLNLGGGRDVTARVLRILARMEGLGVGGLESETSPPEPVVREPVTSHAA
jgi:hypothetical protein